ncbi:MAG: hypothetical protein ACI4QR_01135 [Eubacteriales bacterium]
MAFRKEQDNTERVCAFCEHGTPALPDSDGNVFVVCEKKGMVRDTYVCRRFSYDPLKRDPALSRSLPKMEVIDLDD